MRPLPAGFARNRVTWLAYIALAAFAFYLYALGPVLAFLHTELHLSYTETSLHSTLWAGGTVAAGLGFHRLTRRLGRHRLFWTSAAVTCAGALLFVFGHRLAVTLAAAAVLGTGGSFLLTGTSALLADNHREWRDRALIEANVGASAAAVVAPVLLGFLATTGGGWRVGLLVPLVALGCLFGVSRGWAMPVQPGRPASTSGRGSRGLWGACLLIALVVGIEFCIVFYGIQLLTSQTGLVTADAARMMGLFFGGELAGRVGGAAYSRRPGRPRGLMEAALAVSLVGFVLVWSSHDVAVAAAGLFVTGLGVANLYPVTLAMALAAGREQTDLAAARAQLAVGMAVATAPLVLGALADAVGIRGAFAIEPVLIVIAAVLFAVRPRPGGSPQGPTATGAAATSDAGSS
jgi:MFS family permease